MKKTEYVAPTADKLLKTNQAIDKAIASIKVRGVKLQNDVHIAACSVVKHLFDHKDIRMVHKLMEALPASYRTNAMRDWFTAFAPVAWDKNKPVFNSKFDLSDPERCIRDALLNPFWLFTEEAAYMPVDVVALINSVIKKLDNDTAKSGGKADHADLVAKLTALRPEPAKKTVETVGGGEAPEAADPMATSPNLGAI